MAVCASLCLKKVLHTAMSWVAQRRRHLMPLSLAMACLPGGPVGGKGLVSELLLLLPLLLLPPAAGTQISNNIIQICPAPCSPGNVPTGPLMDLPSVKTGQQIITDTDERLTSVSTVSSLQCGDWVKPPWMEKRFNQTSQQRVRGPPGLQPKQRYLSYQH